MKTTIATAAVAGVLAFAGTAFAQDGQALFNKYGCIACHTVKGKGGKVGPSLDKVGAKGKAYIHESIVDTNKVVAKGFPPNVMPADFGKRIPKAELDTLVNFLAQQK